MGPTKPCQLRLTGPSGKGFIILLCGSELYVEGNYVSVNNNKIFYFCSLINITRLNVFYYFFNLKT